MPYLFPLRIARAPTLLPTLAEYRMRSAADQRNIKNRASRQERAEDGTLYVIFVSYAIAYGITDGLAPR